jgi:hypothetical protein
MADAKARWPRIAMRRAWKRMVNFILEEKSD